MAKESDRARAIRICQGLAQRTEANGCTEAEAMANATKLGALMQQWDLELTDISVRDTTDMVKREFYATDNSASRVITGIGKLCSCVTYNSGSHEGVCVVYGNAADVEIAEYLFTMCMEAADHGFTQWINSPGGKYTVANRDSWRRGFADRVADRMYQLRQQRDEEAAARAAASTGTNLVLLKDQIVEAEFEKLGVRLVYGRAKPIRNVGAFRSGQAHGGSINLNNPLSGPGARPALT